MGKSNEYIWIARDKDNELYAYKDRPFREIREGMKTGQWTSKSIYAYRLDKSWFPELTWGSEPIKLVVKKKIQKKGVEPLQKEE